MSKKTRADIKVPKAIREANALIAAYEADAKDRRCLRGKYAPETGVCRVCGGVVTAEIKFPYTGLLGGPPRQAYIARWACDGCGLVYARRPVA
jgi:rubredoxin